MATLERTIWSVLMEGNNLGSDTQPPAPPQPPTRPAQTASPTPPVPPNQAHTAPQQAPAPQPGAPQSGAPQPSAPEPDAPGGGSGGRSTLFKLFVGLALFSVVSVVLLIGALVVATSVGVFDSDPVDSDAFPQLVQPEATTGEDGAPQESDAVAPTPRDGVNITWDASPSSCDENDKRLFSAQLENGTPGVLEVRMRILDPANNFIHQSHVYTAPASGQVQVDLGGIPSGPSIVQIIDESNDDAIAQTTVRFEDC